MQAIYKVGVGNFQCKPLLDPNCDNLILSRPRPIYQKFHPNFVWNCHLGNSQQYKCSWDTVTYTSLSKTYWITLYFIFLNLTTSLAKNRQTTGIGSEWRSLQPERLIKQLGVALKSGLPEQEAPSETWTLIKARG